ncbi:MAG: PilZ domain-containing protein [Spirochaetota bacterium]|nr:PilZ domain-containing protein [Spirochaetota bacterium]
MHKKPILIDILAIIYILAPVFSLLYFSYTIYGNLPSPISTYFNSLGSIAGPTIDKIAFIACFPIAGIAIYMVRKWSYPVFFLVTAWALYGNYVTWHNNPQGLSLSLLIVATVANFVGVAYVLIPEVRKLYLDPSLRWWESEPRYKVSLENKNDKGEKNGDITNISIGGIFIIPSDNSSLQIGNSYPINFSFGDYKISLSGKVVHHNPNYLKGYGIQFIDLNHEQKSNLKKLTKEFKRQGYDCTARYVHLEQKS